MKKQVFSIIAVFLLIIFSVTACIPDDKKDSNSKDSSVTQDTTIEFDFDSDYGKIANQLDELERVLDSLDEFSEGDLEIPEP